MESILLKLTRRNFLILASTTIFLAGCSKKVLSKLHSTPKNDNGCGHHVLSTSSTKKSLIEIITPLIKLDRNKRTDEKEIYGYETYSFSYNNREKRVFAMGDKNDPGVLLLHELPGLTKECADLGKRISDQCFRVYIPLLFGEAEQDKFWESYLHLLRSNDFYLHCTEKSQPITPWLNALCNTIHHECQGKGISVIGMCLTGTLPLALLSNPHVVAPVLSQPGLPLALPPVSSNSTKRALGISNCELKAAKERIQKDYADNQKTKILGFRFSNDWKSPAPRFDTLRRELGESFEAYEIDSPNNAYNITESAHAVLTDEYKNSSTHPTKMAFERVVKFLRDRLESQS